MQWRWQPFEELSGKEMHGILSLRQQVFVLEQNCVYLDADDFDCRSFHLTGRMSDGQLVVYARLTCPGSRFAEPSIGRLLTRETVRRKGFAKMAVKRAIEKSRQQYPGQNIRLSAQTYLVKFYTEVGFKMISEPYDEDGIKHIDMVFEMSR